MAMTKNIFISALKYEELNNKNYLNVIRNFFTYFQNENNEIHFPSNICYVYNNDIMYPQVMRTHKGDLCLFVEKVGKKDVSEIEIKLSSMPEDYLYRFARYLYIVMFR
jgi:hypothetical protein